MMDITSDLDPNSFLSSSSIKTEGERAKNLKPPFLNEVSFDCLPECGFCCSYKVPLSEEDIESLKTVTDKSFVSRDKRTGRYLKRKDGYCLFLQQDKRCSRYSSRPTYCHIYPLVPKLYGSVFVDIDLSCPGTRIEFNQKDDFIKELKHLKSISIFEPYLQSDPEQEVESITSMLRNRGAFTKPNFLQYIVAHLIKETFTGKRKLEKEVELFRARIEGTKQCLQKLGNIESLKKAKKLVEKGLGVEKVGPNYWSAKRLNSNFDEWRQNTKVYSGQPNTTVELYKFRFNSSQGEFVFFPSSRTIRWTGLNQAKKEWSLDSKRLFFRYLTIWLRRRSALRFAQVSSLQRIGTSNVLASYLDVFRDISSRVCLLAKLFAYRDRKEVVEPSDIRESIRASDNVFR